MEKTVVPLSHLCCFACIAWDAFAQLYNYVLVMLYLQIVLCFVLLTEVQC